MELIDPGRHERQLARSLRGLVEDAYRRGRDDALAEADGQTGRLLTVDEAAARLGVTRKRVYEMLADGRLERVQLGERTLRTTERSIIELIDAARRTTG